MTIETGKCQMCGGPHDYETKYPDGIPWSVNPHSKHCCSFECLVKALEAVGAYQLRRRLRNMPRVSFTSFQEVFGFSEDGGYAKEMYEACQRAPHLFINRLDDENYLKFVTGRL